MNKEQINKAVPEVLGWELVHFAPSGDEEADNIDYLLTGTSYPCDVWKNPQGEFVRGSPPNFYDSLDACFIFESKMREEAFGPNHNNDLEEYINNLVLGCNYSQIASPEDRCKAFLKTKGKLT